MSGHRRLLGSAAALATGTLLAPALRARDGRGVDAGALDPPVSPVGSVEVIERPDGARLHAVVSGRATMPGSPTFVFTHGLSCDHRLWAYQARLLGEIGRVVTWDMRGHGASTVGDAPVARALRPAVLTADLAAVVTQLASGQLATGPLFLIGHSLGGMVSQMALRDYSAVRERTIGAALIASPICDISRATMAGPRVGSGGIDSPGVRLLFGWMAGDPRVHRWFLDPVSSRARGYAALRVGGFGPRPSPAHIESLRAQIAATPPAVRHATLAGMSGVDLRGTLHGVTTPTLVFSGGRDRLVSPGHAAAWMNELPNARAVPFASAGHAVVFERHAAITRRIALLAAETIGGVTDLDAILSATQ